MNNVFSETPPFRLRKEPRHTNQQSTQQTKQQLCSRPFWFVYCGEQVLDKVLKQWPVIFFSLLATAPSEEKLGRKCTGGKDREITGRKGNYTERNDGSKDNQEIVILNKPYKLYLVYEANSGNNSSK